MRSKLRRLERAGGQRQQVASAIAREGLWLGADRTPTTSPRGSQPRDGLLGAVLVAQRRPDEARAVLRRVLAETERIHGASHYEVAVVLENLAALDKRSDPDRAQALYERALGIKRQKLGRTHPEVALLINNLATLHSQQQQYEPALGECTEARNILRQRYGVQHPATRTCESNHLSIRAPIDPGT